ncbi:LOW QUALITY PROTEIN: hypothetical protein CVT26_005447 [Gymnopilus dilepis]|uniref:Uncharacterized protein n=1 Tax=Gymnopilus dilepis TaxID=231916 RepID=A0A409WH87_9AGAR|nr:LOW QUALITY PROTEIN: hypothetical protein CVT26_005447 [Gymnopilus dilepis]
MRPILAGAPPKAAVKAKRIIPFTKKTLGKGFSTGSRTVQRGPQIQRLEAPAHMDSGVRREGWQRPVHVHVIRAPDGTYCMERDRCEHRIAQREIVVYTFIIISHLHDVRAPPNSKFKQTFKMSQATAKQKHSTESG